VLGELILSPDFTAPVARLHLARLAEGAPAEAPTLYRYAGPVFRASVPGAARPNEYLQAGIELIGPRDPAQADVEIFALLRRALGPLAATARATLGDLAVAFAAIDGLTAPERWKAALRRRLWRPAAFRRRLAEMAPDRPAPTETRAALLAAVRSPDPESAVLSGRARPEGARAPQDVAARARELAEDAGHALPAEQAAWLSQVLAVVGPADAALARLRSLDRDAALSAALDRLETRFHALSAAGAAPEGMVFDASFGRSLEYYDGFVFEFALPDAPHLPPLAGGGRYDALLARLGGPAGLPAIGGIVRPEALLAAREAAS
ncbi:MAG: ATP phosphoribosyltransferase regulatory subunit, partial [Pseudomonadota bacterium]